MYIATIHNDNIRTEIHGENQRAFSGSIVKGINTIDSFSLSLLPSNAGFDRLHDFKTLIKIYNTNKRRYEFYGRVLCSTVSMSDSGKITREATCESYLGFLCDSMQLRVASRRWEALNLLKYAINVHNSQVEDYKQFKIGEVTVAGSVTAEIPIKNTWEAIKETLINNLGGEIRLRVVDDDIYIDYLEQIGETKTTKIALSRNMKSITKETDPSEYITRLIPLGGKIGSTEDRLDITSVNGGKNYIDDEEAIARYGVHVGVVEFDDINSASVLLETGRSWLEANNKLKIKYVATALDLSLLGEDIDDFDVCNSYPIINPLIGIDDIARIVKKTIDICEETKSSVEFGEKFASLSDIQLKQSAAINSISKTQGADEAAILEKTQAQVNQSEEKVLEAVDQQYATIEEQVRGLSEQVSGFDERLEGAETANGEQTTQIQALQDAVAAIRQVLIDNGLMVEEETN